MQSLLDEKDKLVTEIDSLKSQIKEIRDKGLKAKDYSKSGGWLSTLKRSKSQRAADKAVAGPTDKRSQKVLEIINNIQNFILAGNFNRANKIYIDNKKKLFPKNTKERRPYDLKNGFGETALMTAVTQRKSDIVEQLVDIGADCNITDNEGETALMIASKYGLLDMVKLLVPRANRDLKTKFTKKTALMYAAEKGHEQICQELLSNGADPTLENIEGKTASDLAANKSVFKVIQKVIKKQNQTEFEDDTLIENEIDSEDEDDLAELLGDEYDPYAKMQKENKEKDEALAPILDEITKLRSEKQQLVDELENAQQKRGPGDAWNKIRTLGHKERSELLQAGNSGKKNNAHITRFHELIANGNLGESIDEVERMLMDKKLKKVKNERDMFGETGLMKAARLGHTAMVDLLVQYKCDLDARDNNGYSAVMKAAEFNRYETLLKLIEEGPNLDYSTKRTKLTALMLSAQRGNTKICKELINEGANYELVNADGVDAKDLCTDDDCREAIDAAIMENPLSRNDNIL